MKTEIDKQAVKDLLAHVRAYTISFAQELLQMLKDGLSILEKIETGEDESTAIENVVEKWFKKNPQMVKKDDEILTLALKECILELDHYTTTVKAQIIDAALEEISKPVSQAERLKAGVSDAVAIYKNLDRRTKELFTILSAPMSVDGLINTDYCNEIFDCSDIDVMTLRKEPDFQNLIELYDLAVDFSQTEGHC